MIRTAQQDECLAKMRRIPRPDKPRPCSFDALIGQTISAISLTSDSQFIQFILNGGERSLSYQTVGNCCNEVWFYHLQGVDAAIGGVVSGIEESLDRSSDYLNDDGEWCSSYKGYSGKEIESDRTDSNRYADVLQWTILTDKGRFVIDVRNDSNGCYSGEIALISEDELATVMKANQHTKFALMWAEVTEDR